MRRRPLLPLALLALVAVLGSACATAPAGGRSREAAIAVRLATALRPFDACDELLDHVRREAAARVGPFGLPGAGGVFRDEVAVARGSAPVMAEGTAPPAPADAVRGPAEGDASAETKAAPGVSGTNIQEAGVDEPDTVKTDGRRIFAVARGRLQVLEVADGRHRLVGGLALHEGGGHELLLAGDRLLVLSSAWARTPLPLRAQGETGARGAGAPLAEGLPSLLPAVDRTAVSLVDVSDPTRPGILSTLEVEGRVLGARMVGDVARVVTSASPAGLAPGFPTRPGPEAESRATEDNRQQIERSAVVDWLPAYRLDAPEASPGEPAVTSGLLVPCERVSRPAEFSGLGTISVLTFDLSENLGTGEAVSVLADGQTVYASADALYVATTRYPEAMPLGDPQVGAPAEVAPDLRRPQLTTEIHKFAIAGPGPARHVASGQVRGDLLNQFSMSEHDGRLRVATTDGSPGAGVGSGAEEASESLVTVLEDRAGALVPVGEVADLGRGERIYAVRFIGPVGYVVTFRQTDPLYTIDLSDPARPRMAGELKIPGYSAYLHPLGEGLLLGVGQDATTEGRRLGAQVSLFDVSDPARPQRLDQAALGQGSTSAEFDHHAFLWWAPRGLAVLPVQLFDHQPFSGAVGLSVNRDRGIDEVGRITHAGASPSSPPPTGTKELAVDWADPIQRSLVIGDTLYTVSERGILASAAGDLSPLGWVGF